MNVCRSFRLLQQTPKCRNLNKWMTLMTKCLDINVGSACAQFDRAVAGALFVSRPITSNPKRMIRLSDDACPQGVQGDEDETFKIWADNCRRYGLQNCVEQLQGIQSGRKTLHEVLTEQEKLIADIAAQYKTRMEEHNNVQGVQDNYYVLPDIETPCPQGIQGDQCERFKLWLENCHRFGLHDCLQQYTKFKAGRKTLGQILEEQDRAIREAARVVQFQQRRKYSTKAGSPNGGKKAEPEGAKDEGAGDPGQLTQRQRLRKAVREYGSTVIVFHVFISLMSLGFFYTLVSSGIDVIGLIKKMGIATTFLENKVAAGTSTFVIAYGVHKVFAPARIATTLTATPFIVRYLRQKGILKVSKVKSG